MSPFTLLDPHPFHPVLAHTHPSCSILSHASPGLCCYPTPRTKGTFDILCLAYTHSVSVGPTGPCSWDLPPSPSPGPLQELCSKRRREEGALKEQSLLSESVPYPPPLELAGKKLSGGGGQEICPRRLQFVICLRLGWWLKPSLLLAPSRGLLSLSGFLVSSKRTGSNLALICCVTLGEFLSFSGSWSPLYKMKRKN